MKIAVLSNVNLDHLIHTLEKQYDVFESYGYGNWVQYAVSAEERLANYEAKYIFLLLDGTSMLEHCQSVDDGCTELDKNLGYINAMVSHYPGATIVVSTIDILENRITSAADIGIEREWEVYWLKGLQSIVREHDQVLMFDLKKLLYEGNKSAVYSSKMWYMGSIPYTMGTIQHIAHQMENYIQKYQQVRKKVLVLDLDNTIWGGVVGEDGPNGIVLGESLYGAAYRDAQKRIKEISNTGILLTIASKNNLEDVLTVFEKNPFMVLKKEDFSCIMVNWEDKAANIAAMARQLNLGLDSFVFLDDNPVERENVKRALPEVSVPDFPKDTASLPRLIQQIYEVFFYCAHLTEEDKNKKQQYQQEYLRAERMRSAVSMDDYLDSLHIQIKVSEVTESQIERTVQLLNKTNQFNTNTVRMDREAFLHYLAQAENHVFVANVSDCYGDSGLVLVCMVRYSGNQATIEEFLMSCRVMGRQIEQTFIAALLKHLYEKSIAEVTSSYIKTEKNKPVADLWEKLGFIAFHKEEDRALYKLSLPQETKIRFPVEWLQ